MRIRSKISDIIRETIRPIPGVDPAELDVLALVEDFARQLNLAEPGDRVVVVSGRPIGTPGATNTLVVHTMP